MVLGVLTAVIAAPSLLGSQEAIRQSQSKEKREEHRARRCNLIATCVKSSMRSKEINGRPIVLRNGKLWIDTGTSDGAPFGHPYAGYYLPYPDTQYEGLVTTVTEEAPIMNWVYVDKETYEVKYGVRLNAQPNLTGPFDCTRQDRRLTFLGWEGFCAVEEYPTLWALYFDKDDDGLRSKVAAGTRVLEIELSRKEKRWEKEVEVRQQDQTTKREVDVKTDAPVDKPITVETQLDPPGVGIDKQRQEGRDQSSAAAQDAQAPYPKHPKPLAIPKPIFPGLNTRPWATSLRPLTPPPAYSAKGETSQELNNHENRPDQSGPLSEASKKLNMSSQSESAMTAPKAPKASTQDGPARPSTMSSEPNARSMTPPLPEVLEYAGPAATEQQHPLNSAHKNTTSMPISSSKSVATGSPPPKTPSAPVTTSPNSPKNKSLITPGLRRSSGIQKLAHGQVFKPSSGKPQGITPPKKRPTSNLKQRVSSVFVQNGDGIVTKHLANTARPDSPVLAPSAPLPLRPARSGRDTAASYTTRSAASNNTIISSNIPRSLLRRAPTSPKSPHSKFQIQFLGGTSAVHSERSNATTSRSGNGIRHRIAESEQASPSRGISW